MLFSKQASRQRFKNYATQGSLPEVVKGLFSSYSPSYVESFYLNPLTYLTSLSDKSLNTEFNEVGQLIRQFLYAALVDRYYWGMGPRYSEMFDTQLSVVPSFLEFYDISLVKSLFAPEEMNLALKSVGVVLTRSLYNHLVPPREFQLRLHVTSDEYEFMRIMRGDYSDTFRFRLSTFMCSIMNLCSIWFHLMVERSYRGLPISESNVEASIKALACIILPVPRPPIADVITAPDISGIRSVINCRPAINVWKWSNKDFYNKDPVSEVPQEALILDRKVISKLSGEYQTESRDIPGLLSRRNLELTNSYGKRAEVMDEHWLKQTGMTRENFIQYFTEMFRTGLTNKEEYCKLYSLVYRREPPNE